MKLSFEIKRAFALIKAIFNCGHEERLCECNHRENSHGYDPRNSKITYPCREKGCSCETFHSNGEEIVSVGNR